MVIISDLKVGDIIKNEFDGITRDLLQMYAKASGDTNPIHTNDVVAERAGLKGVIAHGLFSFGFISKLFEDYLEHGKIWYVVFEVQKRGIVVGITRNCVVTLFSKSTPNDFINYIQEDLLTLV